MLQKLSHLFLKGFYLHMESHNLGSACGVLCGWGWWGGLTGRRLTRTGWDSLRARFGRVEVIIQSLLSSDVNQHVVLVYPDQRGKDLTLRGKRGASKGALEEVEDGNKSSDCLVRIGRAMYGDCGHCQHSTNPRASTKLPHPCWGVNLKIMENSCGDSRGKKDHVNESFGDIVKTAPNLRDRNVAASCCIAATTVVLGRG